MSTADQPISRVLWLPRVELQANEYNPNHQAPPEHRLLRTSLLEDGWTMPIVAREHAGRMEIVDGFHKWKLSADKDVAALTDGQVPVTLLPEVDEHRAMLSTIRHNRARGTHGVVPMAEIVARLIESGMTPDEVQQRLGMDDEEVDRLSDRGGMPMRAGLGDFNQGWTS